MLGDLPSSTFFLFMRKRGRSSEIRSRLKRCLLSSSGGHEFQTHL